MLSTVRSVFVLMMMTVHISRAHKSSSAHSAPPEVPLGSEYVMSLAMLGLTVFLSGIIYLWVLRYICIGCCQPVSVGAEPEALDGMV